jgi:hypothetical protein
MVQKNPFNRENKQIRRMKYFHFIFLTTTKIGTKRGEREEEGKRRDGERREERERDK